MIQHEVEPLLSVSVVFFEGFSSLGSAGSLLFSAPPSSSPFLGTAASGRGEKFSKWSYCGWIFGGGRGLAVESSAC